MLTQATLKRYLRTAAFVVAALYAPSLAAQTMTLTVPYRGGLSMQAAQTVIEFDASSIGAGATISVAGTSVTVPASPCAGLGCVAVDSTSAGDDILVRRISTTNRARLELTYLASFGANFCVYTGPTGDKTFTVELSGFAFASATDNGYRITSFMAPSDASCDVAYARVPGPRPSISDTTLTKLGRLPLNVVLALDRSPSMEWTIPGSTDIRWDRLKSSVQLFTSVWDVVGAPPPPATVSSEGHADDRLGLIFFGGTSSESPLDGTSFFKSRGTSVSPWSGPITTALNTGSFIGGTSIGAGTDNARTRLDTVDAVNGDTAIVLFTDGEQNRPPCIIRDGETTSPTTKPYPGLPGVTYEDQCTVAAAASPSALLTLNGDILAQDVPPRGPIFTIGLGEGGMAASAQLLDEVSGETAGRARFPNDGVSMDTSFVDSLVDNLKGGTVSMLERTFGSLTTAGVSPPMQVVVDPSLTRVVFVLAWEGSRRKTTLEILRPDGTVVTPPLHERTASSLVEAVNLPSDGPSGVWQVRVLPGPAALPLAYHLTAYGVESRLSAGVTESRRTGTGQPIKIVAEVGWDDGGLADLPDGAIRATIERPSENLGNILHQSVIDVKGNESLIPPNLISDISPLMLKISQLARGAGLLDRIDPHPLPQPVELVSVGHGRYEGRFDGTNVGGRYRIRVVFDWNDERTGEIRRIHVAERQVVVRPTVADSLVELTRNIDAGTAQILITPQDRFGNLVGPGYENHFRVELTGAGKAAAPVDPAVTGTYAVNVTGLPAEADPRIKIVYQGETLRDAPLSRVEEPVLDPTGGRAWSLSLHGGLNDPQGNAGNVLDGGLSAAIDLEYLFTDRWALELFLGYDEFDSKFFDADFELTHLNVNAKAYFLPGPNRVFLLGGVGIFEPDSGSSEFGWNVGGGGQWNLWPKTALEATARYYSVSSGGSFEFVTVHLGARFRF